MAQQFWDEGIEGSECFACGKFFIKKYEWQQQCWDCFLSSEKGREWVRSKQQQGTWREGYGGGEERSRKPGWDNSQTARERYARQQQEAQQRENQRKYDEANREAHRRAEQQQRQREWYRQKDTYNGRKPFEEDPFKFWEDAGRSKREYEGWKNKFDDQGSPRSSHDDSGSVAINKELLRKLLQLCHPDRHGGSDLANSVTQELLKMKGKL